MVCFCLQPDASHNTDSYYSVLAYTLFAVVLSSTCIIIILVLFYYGQKHTDGSCLCLIIMRVFTLKRG